MFKGLLVIATRIIGAGLLFTNTILMARGLPIDEFGVIMFCQALLTILSVGTRFGLDTVALKYIIVGNNFESKNFEFLLNSLFWSALFTAAVFAFLWFLDSLRLEYYWFKFYVPTLLFLAPFLIPFSLNFILSNAVKALQKPVLSNANQVIVPNAIVAVSLGAMSISDITMSLSRLALVLGFSYLVACFANSIVLSRAFTTKVLQQHYKISTSFLKRGLPFLLIGSTALLLSWTDIIVVSIFASAEDVGLYSAASRLAFLSTLILYATNSITAVKYAHYHRCKNKKGLREASKEASLLLWCLSIPITLVLLIFPEFFLNMFGTEFTSATYALRILVIGQFVNVVCGSVGYLLSMTNNEWTLHKILIASALLNLSLSTLLIENFGIVGVAMATTLSVAFWNIAAIFAVWKKFEFIAISNPFHLIELMKQTLLNR